MISHFRRLIVIALLPLAVLVGCDSRAAKVREVDDAYDRAMDTRNGSAAVAMLSKDSLALLDRLVAAARTESKKKVQARPTMEQAHIIMARLIFTPAELKKATGREYHVKRIEKGWGVSGSSLEREKISVMKDRAVITYWDEPSQFRSRWYYVLEDGAWKLDLVTAADEYDSEDRQIAKDHGLTLEQLIMTWVGDATQMSEVPDSVWNPPR